MAEDRNNYPKSETISGKVWAIADCISEETSKPASRRDVLMRTEALGIKHTTASTQYGRWRAYHGLTKTKKE